MGLCRSHMQKWFSLCLFIIVLDKKQNWVRLFLFKLYFYLSFGSILWLFSLSFAYIVTIYEATCHAFTKGPALHCCSNVSYCHTTRLNIHLCLGFQRQNCKCLQWASFPGPITPPHHPELNFTPVMTAIWSDSELGNAFNAANPCGIPTIDFATHCCPHFVVFAGDLFSSLFCCQSSS